MTDTLNCDMKKELEKEGISSDGTVNVDLIHLYQIIVTEYDCYF